MRRDTKRKTKLPTLEEYKNDIVETSTAAGWYEDTRTLGEECALLHSEISEMFEAYRDNGLDPFFHQTSVLGMGSNVLLQGHAPEGVKPEGVGSEAADVFIRMLDTCNRIDVPVQAIGDAYPEQSVDLVGTFGDNITELHRIVSNISITGNPVDALSKLLATLHGVCARHGIDLMTEVDRKIAFNKTRAYRHGGKRI